MIWPKYLTKPVLRKRKGNLRGYLSPLTGRAGGSIKIGPLSITGTGRVYLFGARVR